MARLSYGDYRRLRHGDPGWTPALEKAKNYYSPSEDKIISGRKYQELARGKKYEEYAKERQQQGIERQKYKKRKEKPRGGIIYPKDYKSRVEYLKDSFAAKQSLYVGEPLDWDELSDAEKTTFWEVYHHLVDKDKGPTYDEYIDEYDDWFDMNYEDFYNIEYGPTP